MKTIALIALLLFAGCSTKTNQSNTFVLPPELSHCKIYYMQGGMAWAYVVHCPNATTTTTHGHGKQQQTIVVVDGIEYVQKK